MRQLKMVMLLVTVAILAGQAQAAGEMLIVPVQEPVQPFPMGPGINLAVDDCCKVGNLNPYAHAVPNFISGAEKYAYMWLVEPVCGCDTGFYLRSVHMIIQLGPEDVPVTIQANASFEETQLAPTGGYLIPGPPICTSPTYTGTFTDPGAYEVELPLTEANCLCAEFGYHYAITMNILTPLANPLDLVVDDVPVGGVSWIDQGNGWYDLQSYQLPGEVKLTAKLLCCSPPVPDEKPSWGSVKALFR